MLLRLYNHRTRSTHGEMRHKNILIIIPERRPTCKWNDIIKMELKGTELKVIEWIQLDQHRDKFFSLVSTVMKFRVSQKAGNSFTS